jgi:DeoR family fructose operon transcriptional repressor
MVPDLRKKELLNNIAQKDVVYIKDLADELGISLSTIRRDLQSLQEDGEIILLRGGAARVSNRDFDEPVVRKKLINSDAKEIIAKKAAELVQDGDCIYVDSGTTTVAMLKYLSGKNITIVSSSTQLMDYMPIKGGKCILLGGEVRDDLESVFGSLTEKMISNMYFDKAFIGANGYIEDGGIYTYDPREARKKEIVKEYSKQTYALMDTSKRNKYAFAKAFDLNECILITEV